MKIIFDNKGTSLLEVVISGIFFSIVLVGVVKAQKDLTKGVLQVRALQTIQPLQEDLSRMVLAQFLSYLTKSTKTNPRCTTQMTSFNDTMSVKLPSEIKMELVKRDTKPDPLSDFNERNLALTRCQASNMLEVNHDFNNQDTYYFCIWLSKAEGDKNISPDSFLYEPVLLEMAVTVKDIVKNSSISCGLFSLPSAADNPAFVNSNYTYYWQTMQDRDVMPRIYNGSLSFLVK